MENNTNTQTEGNNTQQTAGNSTEAKTFTQEEVNRIVQERLARERRGTGQTIEERELDLTRRENRMKCAERLSESGYPKELLDILDTSNAETFMENVGKLAAMQIQARTQHRSRGWWALLRALSKMARRRIFERLSA